MLVNTHHQRTLELLHNHADRIEEELDADVVFYHGPIIPPVISRFREFIEDVFRNSRFKTNEKDGLDGHKHRAIAVFLQTNGGSPEVAENMNRILRHHYEHVYFVVPDYAMSAGTILCMSGDKIYMDYSSRLGPIDPQVASSDGKNYVPAMGYLDKLEEMNAKPELSQSDMLLLRQFDLGKIALYEQARDLSIDLLKEWLVKYKFKNWNIHRTDSKKKGNKVTLREKRSRAAKVAKDLTNHKKWRSHSRHLDLEKLQELRIEIDDYSHHLLYNDIRQFNDNLTWILDKDDVPFYLYHKSHVS